MGRRLRTNGAKFLTAKIWSGELAVFPFWTGRVTGIGGTVRVVRGTWLRVPSRQRSLISDRGNCTRPNTESSRARTRNDFETEAVASDHC